MAHALCDVLLQVHGTIAASAIGAFYFYSDRTEGFISSLNGTEAVLAELRRRISAELGEQLGPVFEVPGSVPSPVLGPDGTAIDRGAYVERPVNPIGSESFREALRDFIDDRANSLADYRSLVIARVGWCFWSTLLSRLLLALFVWQVALMSLLFLDKYGKVSLADWAVSGVCTVTGTFFVVVVASAFVRLNHYSTITNLRLKHGSL